MRGVWGTKATPYLLEGDLIGPSHAQKQLSPSPSDVLLWKEGVDQRSRDAL